MKLLLISLGCDKNRVDSEKMLGALTKAGFEITSEEAEAEVCLVNTCCFIGDAKKESIETILEMAALKEKASLKALIVTGCLGVRYKDEILKEIPEIDAVCGITSEDSIVSVIEEALSGKQVSLHTDLSRNMIPDEDRVMSTGSAYAYMKIAEGCDKNCTYCVIPSVRGHYRSRPMEELVAEAERLAQQGIRELILVAQETTLYGLDLYGQKSLHTLMKRLCAVEGIAWIRLLYAYPEEIYPDLIEVMAEEPKICHYIDMPIQHINDDILRRMNRRTNRASIEAMIRRVRERIPDMVLRTTLLSGFPGETEEAHKELVDFVETARFERLGVFAYSREEGTPAALMKDQVHPSTKKRRQRELMEVQRGISLEKGENMVGRTVEVMIEGYLPEDGVYIGRTRGDAPDVDGCVFVIGNREYMSGDLIPVRITEALEYDLEGVAEDESAQ